MQLLLDSLTKLARQRRGDRGWGHASSFLQSPHTQVWHQERPVDGRGTCATQAQWCNDGHEFSESRGSVHFICESSGPRSELADWGSKWGVAGRGLLKSENTLEKVTTSQNLMFSSTCWEPCGDLALYYFWIWKINCNWKTEGIKIIITSWVVFGVSAHNKTESTSGVSGQECYFPKGGTLRKTHVES